VAAIHIDEPSGPHPELVLVAGEASALRRARIRALPLRPVARVAALVTASAALSLTVAGAGLWWIGRATGAVGATEDFLAEAFGMRSFAFSGPSLLLGWIVLLAASALAVTIMALLAAAVYNRSADVVGGLEVEVDVAAGPSPDEG